MGAVLNPSTNGKYFDEIRSLISPEHVLDASELSNDLINQFSYLGRAELKVLAAADMSAADLRVTDDTPDVVPTDAVALRNRQLIWKIQALTAHSMLVPQVISETNLGDMVRLEEFSIEKRREFLEQQIDDVPPKIFSASTSETETTQDSSIEIVTTNPLW